MQKENDINIGDDIEVFMVDGDDVHIITTGTVKAIFSSGWDGKTRYVIESMHVNDQRYRVVLRYSIRMGDNVELRGCADSEGATKK